MAVMASKAKKISAEKKVTAAHPPYAEMIKEAIASLKERTGSSQIAIAKFIDDKHAKNLPANYKKLLLSQLKRLVASGSLVKVKHSFKLGTTAKPTTTKPKTAAKPKAKVAGVTPVKAKKAVVKVKKVTPKKVLKPKKAMPKSATPAVMKAKKAVMKTKAVKPKSVKSPAKKVAAKKAKK